MTQIRTKDQNFKWHYGRLGGYLEDKNKNLFGITCRHVTQAAHDGIVYIQNKTGEFVRFGKTVERLNNFEIVEDIDLILVDKNMLPFCDISVTNSKGKVCSINIYDGPVGMLFCQEVFMRSISSSFGNFPFYHVYCKVASAEIHNFFKQELDTHKNFLVEASGHIKPGDSGNLLVIETDGDFLSIVGLILGGSNTRTDQEYVLCLRFDYGKKLLEAISGKSLELPKMSEVTTNSQYEKERTPTLQVGVCIWVKVPEDVAKTDFVLFEHLVMLIDCFGYQEFSVSATKLENQFEAQLSKDVNSRNTSLHLIKCETLDQKCFLECMIGCEYLYSGNIEQSDKHLKDAVRLISKTSCRNRLLCKLITYSTWQLLETGRLENMKELLEDGAEYMLKMKDCNACPIKSIGYHYFDYARYYNHLQNYEEAMCMARKSLEYFILDERHRGRPSHGKCFAFSMIARLNLLCGNHFETRHMQMLDLNEAQECVAEIKRFGKELPAVVKATYLIVKADLHYRRGEIEKAKSSAMKCLNLAKKNDLKKEIYEAEIRFKELSSVSKHV